MRVVRNSKTIKKHQLELRGTELFCDGEKVEYAGNGIATEYNGVVTAAVKLTLPLIEALLERNEANRTMSADAKKKLENSLVNSGLIYAPEQGIGISESWVLLNGQHRLEAIRHVWGHIPGECVVQLSMGERDDAYETIDRQRKRSIADALRKPQTETSVLKNVASFTRVGWDPLTVTKAMYEVLERYNAESPFTLTGLSFKFGRNVGRYDDVKTGVLLYCLYVKNTYWVDHLQEILEGSLLENEQAERLHKFWQRRKDIIDFLTEQRGGMKGRPSAYFSHTQDIMNTFLSLESAVPENLRETYVGSDDFHRIRNWIKGEMEASGRYSF